MAEDAPLSGREPGREPGSQPPAAPEVRPRSRSILRRIGRAYGRFVRLLTTVIVGFVLIVLGITFINYVVLSTPKNRAYRDIDPSVGFCTEGFDKGWTMLADVGRDNLGKSMVANDGGWADPTDDETDVIARHPDWRQRFGCALQHHVIPATKPGTKAVDYYLGFLEFNEDGQPYALVSANAGSTNVQIDSAMLRHAMDLQMRKPGMTMAQVKPVLSQLDVLKQHLSAGSNFVLVFIHGWRHDARIGDSNVADVRLYAANAARFIAQRCPIEPSFCNMKVTAIYVGWRGARVDEQGLKSDFGQAIGGTLGTLSAGATLFDRKPVSEAVAPGAISAIRSIEAALAPSGGAGDKVNKMIVIGHSLGGNILATGLKDDLIKAVRRHKPGEIMPPVLGDLVVLVNPASEATKWTSVQREVWDRTAGPSGPETSAEDVIRDNDFFPAQQKPVMISITAALNFPAGGLRPGDCAWIGLDVDDKFAEARKRIRDRLAASGKMFNAGLEYDWATHDLFPTFKLDFRAAAAYLDRAAARFEGREPQGEGCTPPKPAAVVAELETLPIHALSTLLGTFPFQNTVAEESHTIGNLDPPRPAAGVLADALPTASPFGTTHEMQGYHEVGHEAYHPYATLADADIDCPLSNRWLSRARAAQKHQYGLFWDSSILAAAEPGIRGQGKPAAQFLHGLQLTGMAPITRANDPFWNIRAFDNELSRHDGYRLPSFICAISQLVLDDTTGAVSPMTNHTTAPVDPMVNPNP